MGQHKLLKRQIRKHLGSAREFMGTPVMEDFLAAVNRAYKHNDRDRDVLERSLDITSDELVQKNEELEQRLKQTAESHEQLEQLFSIINSTLQASLDGIILMDEDDDPMLFNQRAAELLGTTQDVIGRSSYDTLQTLLNDNAINPEVFSRQLSSIAKNPAISTSGTLEMNNGLIVEVYSQARIQDDKTMGRVWNFHDITELRQNEETIRHRAYHDSLTNLPNRTLFTDRINHALTRYKRSEEEFALLFIDLDGFKYVNDTLGHEIGDQVLIEVAKRLDNIVREHDTIARHGGDEFLLMLELVENSLQIKEIASRILQVLSEAFVLDEQEIHISASIGITIAPKDGHSSDELIRNADMAMYSAKAQGRNNYQFFDRSMAESSKRQLSLQSQLNQALRKEEFQLHYQPKIDLKTRRITGAEALLRWYQGGEILIGPTEFIGIAEQSGLIVPISEWVLNTACQQLADWLPHLPDDFVLSINMSAQHFMQRNVVETIIGILDRHKIPCHRIELELTESVVIEDPKNSIAKLKLLRARGIKLSIDDFGTGYSSFNYLKNLPIHTIKIDRSFIKDVESSSRDLSLVESIVNIAHTLGLNVVAEGVESEEIHGLLQGITCDMGQGYLYSRPLPADDFAQQLDNIKA